MSFATTYFSRFTSFEPFIEDKPNNDLQIVIVIPCFSENEITKTLHSLLLCKLPKVSVEVIVVVNYSEIVDENVKAFNIETYTMLQKFSLQYSIPEFTIHAIIAKDLPKKHAGVGFSRKIGMDEAIRRFNYTNNSQGIIICLDADSLVESNYIDEIYTYFTINKKCTAANIHFEHPITGELPQSQYNAIVQYELHLRYYVEMLHTIKFPYSFHTVGSSCCLRAEAYCRQGGMNKRQAGEDFYFLQKLFQSESFGTITHTKVIPSARTSHRVPFGTGFAMQNLMKMEIPIYTTYSLDAFFVLQDFFEKIPLLFTENNYATIYKSYHKSIQLYVELERFNEKIAEIKNNSKTLDMFIKRFYVWFNGFQVFKYLNFSHQHFFEKIPVQQAAAALLENKKSSIYESLNALRLFQKQRTI